MDASDLAKDIIMKLGFSRKNPGDILAWRRFAVTAVDGAETLAKGLLLARAQLAVKERRIAELESYMAAVRRVISDD